MKLWGGRFGAEDGVAVEAEAAERAAAFARSIDVDAELALDDIAGSIAHVRGLGPGRPADRRRGRRRSSPGWQRLAARRRERRAPLGPGARGRPPQPRGRARRAGRAGRRPAPHRPVAERPGRHGPAALDAPGRRPARRRPARVRATRSSPSPSARATPSCPGTTHIQPAQPVLFGHHLLAYVEMAERDRGRLADARRRLNVSPLGRGALAGRGLPARSRDDGRASSGSTA